MNHLDPCVAFLETPDYGGGMWHRVARDYKELIENSEWDSHALRQLGLVPKLLELIGDCRDATLLDAGTGTGWLFNHVTPNRAYACDIVVPEALPQNVQFSTQDIQSLGYASGAVDIIVCSLVLMFCKDLERACSELHRVATPGTGRLIVALTHPYFYRTGFVDDDGNVVVSERLGADRTAPLKIGGHVGPVEYFYRPFPRYINVLIDAGWTIRRVFDWFVDLEAHQRRTLGQATSKIRRTDKVPLYTFIECGA